jgi:hypothetical protein
MGGGSLAKDHPWEYLAASAMSASINYPLWRASAVGQSGFSVSSSHLRTTFLTRQAVAIIPVSITPYLYAFAPPYKGMMATILGMTWARAAIFWGSDYGKYWLEKNYPRMPSTLSTVLPPLLTSTGVQIVNMPVVRASITLQNPDNSHLPNIRASLSHIYTHNGGLKGLWHGTSAGILKTVPKYCTAIFVKDYMDTVVLKPLPENATSQEKLWRSAVKSMTAGAAGAALTNPLDVIRNEMFKTNLGLTDTIKHLHSEMGWDFLVRGMGKNLIAVAIPVGSTIFFTDALIQYSSLQRQ